MQLISDSLQIMLTILLEFLGELYLYSLLATVPLKKKNNYWMKLVVGILIMIPITFLLSIVYHFYGNTIIGRTLIYLILFSLLCVHFYYLIDDKFSRVLVFLDFAYVIQNIGYRIWSSIWEFLVFINLISQSNVTELVYRLIFYPSNILIIVALYFIFIRIGRKHLKEAKVKTIAIWLSLLIVIANNVICSIFDINFIQLVGENPVTYDNPIYYYIRLTTSLLSLLLSGCVVFLLFNAQERYDLQKDVEQLNYIIGQSQKQYEMSQELIETINIKCHDMRHRIRYLLSENESMSKDKMKDITDVINIYDASIKTGNKTLDTILTEKSLICETNKISLTCMADGESLGAIMDQVDIVCLIGNIVDNAIEAVKHIEDVDHRIIDFSIQNVGQMLIIQCQNYYDGSLKEKDGGFITTKEDKNYHGFGISSIKNIVFKYNGEISINTDDNIFKMNIVINKKY